tara:strand:- start:150 stop:551 length:402 start_codon:yes stop_codon:yes gene_type:complete
MKWSLQQVLYTSLFTITFIILALWSSEANFIPSSSIWFIGVAGIFIATHVYIMNYNRDWYYEVNIKNNGFLYSQAIVLFVLEFISYLNSKEAFLGTPSTMEVFKWIITLALFLSIIRVIRPLSRSEWGPKNKS